MKKLTDLEKSIARSGVVMNYAIETGVQISCYKRDLTEDYRIIDTIKYKLEPCMVSIHGFFTAASAFTKEGVFLVGKIFNSDKEVYECFCEKTYNDSLRNIIK